MTISERVKSLEEQVKNKNLEYIASQRNLVEAITSLNNSVKEIFSIKNTLQMGLNQIKLLYSHVAKFQDFNSNTDKIIKSLIAHTEQLQQENKELKQELTKVKSELKTLTDGYEMVSEQIAILHLQKSKTETAPRRKTIKSRFLTIMENDTKHPIK